MSIQSEDRLPVQQESNESPQPVRECSNSPDGYHEPQRKSTIPACVYCGKIL